MTSIAPMAHTLRKDLTTDSLITPKWLIDRLGPFDLDPCACDPQPWACASEQWTENGLMRPWFGMVWLNPPYGRQLGAWLNRLALHGNGMALIFARTDTRAFHNHVWPFASLVLFLRGRLTFCRPNGDLAPEGHNSGGPSVLIAYGEEAVKRLVACRDLGVIVKRIDAARLPLFQERVG